MIDVVVVKFGGSILSSCEGFARAAEIVLGLLGSGRRVVVVASAVRGVTDLLLSYQSLAAEELLARLRRVHEEASRCLPGEWRARALGWVGGVLSSLARVMWASRLLGEAGSPRTTDLVAAHGELLSIGIVAAALGGLGVRARPLSGWEAGIVTDGRHGSARPLHEESRRRVVEALRPLLEEGVVPVVAGFTGASREGFVTTLGRGGSDYTATLLAWYLGAGEVRLYTSVEGILSGDPGVVGDPVTVPAMSYWEADDTSKLGLVKTHPRAFEPAAEAGVPVRVLSASTGRGTLVSEKTLEVPVKTVVLARGRVSISSTPPTSGEDEGVVASMYSAMSGRWLTIRRGGSEGRPADIVGVVGVGVREPEIVGHVYKLAWASGGEVVVSPATRHSLVVVAPPGRGALLARRLHEEVVRPWLTG